MTNDEFAERALQLVGRPYSEVDCIGVVRTAAKIRCQGTNWLWRSIDNAPKYRYLIDRIERPPTREELIDGLLVFRIRWDKVPEGYSNRPDCHHVGVIYGGKVIQSNPDTGVTVTAYNLDQWHGAGRLKQISYTHKSDFPAEDYEESELENELPFTDIDPDSGLSDHEMILAIYNYLIRD